jgi:hypothetical protein
VRHRQQREAVGRTAQELAAADRARSVHRR